MPRIQLWGFPILFLQLVLLVVPALFATEPLGPSNRRTPLVISEIMYHPARNEDGLKLEFIEIFNSNPWPTDISGFWIRGDVHYSFPANTVIPGGGFLVVARQPVDLEAFYGMTNVLGPYTNNLVNSGGTLQLRNRANAILWQASYRDDLPWPVAADGAGPSLVLARPSYGEKDPRSWAASAQTGGSPGRPEPIVEQPLEGLRINEFLANPAEGEEDFIELYNYSTSDLDISGFVISDNPGTDEFTIPDGTFLPAHGHLAWHEGELGFSLSALKGKIFVLNPTRTRVLDAVSYKAQAQAVSSGRFPDGTSEIYSGLSPTPGEPNPRHQQPEMVISEIRYHPVFDLNPLPRGLPPLEFVELYNPGTNKIFLRDWSLGNDKTGPLDFHATILPGAYFALPMQDALSDSGERLALGKRHSIVEPDENTGELVTSTVFPAVTEVTYGTGGRWGHWSDGGGSSLERIDLRANPRLAANWTDSAPLRTTPWVLVEMTGVLDLGAGVCDGVDIMILGEGEMLVDNVEVMAEGGQNLVANPSFENGTAGWSMHGNHERSGWATGNGYNSAHSLHVRASGRGDPGVNRIRAKLATPLEPGTTATIRARVRWLRGWPEILLRLQGNYLEATRRFRLFGEFDEGGTPGITNSRAMANAGPAIFNVSHSPILPDANQAITITAAADDPDGVTSMLLRYRVDPSNSFAAVTMNDSGLDGDEIPGDGVYAARIPGQPAGVLIAYHVEAQDGFAPPVETRFPADAPARECLVRFGDAAYENPFGTYRLWMTQATFDHWSSREKQSNEPLDVTFVYGAHRVIYNAGALFSGSPTTSAQYDTPTGTLCSYDVLLPADDPFLGADHIVLDFPAGDPTAQRQQLMHWFAEQLGLPYNHRRPINLFVNGVGQGSRSGFGTAGTIYEDAQQPNSDMIKQWFEGRSDGNLFKAEDWTEFTPEGDTVSTVPNTLERFTTTGARKKAARYRWNWRPRSRVFALDPFPRLFELVDAFGGTGEPLKLCTDPLVDRQQWMRTFAMNDLSANWDSFGNPGGKNTFLYKPEWEPWVLFSWDFDTGLGLSGAAPDLPLFAVADPTLGKLYAHPASVRPYWRALDEALRTFYRNESIDAMLDAHHQALAAVGAQPPGLIKSFIAQRRAFLLQNLPVVDAPFAITTNDGQSFDTNHNYLILAGTAPISVETITVNGGLFPVTWTSASTWTVPQALRAGENKLVLEGYDQWGERVSGASNVITVRFAGVLDDVQSNVVMTEVYNYPLVCGSDFIELMNRSSTTAFELGEGFRPTRPPLLPSRVVLPPGEFQVTASERCAFWQTFGWDVPLAGEMPPIFDCIYEFKPHSPVCRYGVCVHSEGFPWPLASPGVSLQLIDPEEQNDHPGNWTSDPSAANSPGRTNSVQADLPPFPKLYLNEILPQNASGITDGAGDHDPWLELFTEGTNTVDLTDFHLTDDHRELRRWRFPPGSQIGPAEFRLVWLDAEPDETTAQEWHAAFRASPQSGQIVMSRLVDGRDIFIHLLRYPGSGHPAVMDQSYGLWRIGGSIFQLSVDQDYPTPLATNVYTPPPPPTNNIYPVIRINEWMASNTRIPDPADGDLDDWFELYTFYTNGPVDLSGYMLTDDLARTNKFVIPPGYFLPPKGFVLLWADEEAEQSQTNGDLHVNFKLSKSGELIALFYPDGSLADIVTFGQQTNDVSQGRWRDGTADIYYMTNATPKRSNVRDGLPDCPPPGVRIIVVQSFFGSFVAVAYPAEDCHGRAILECKDELDDPEWVEVPSQAFEPNFFSENGQIYHGLVDSFNPSTRQRFYRVRIEH